MGLDRIGVTAGLKWNILRLSVHQGSWKKVSCGGLKAKNGQKLYSKRKPWITTSETKRMIIGEGESGRFGEDLYRRERIKIWFHPLLLKEDSLITVVVKRY